MQDNDQLILPFSLAHQKNEEEKVQRKIKERRKRKENLTSFLFKWRKQDQKKLMLHTCQTHTHRYVSPNTVDHKARVCQTEKKLLEHMQR